MAWTASRKSSGTSTTAGFNFGNPSFSISSGNTDDNGYGNFEYAPPSGYLALCTQNLATELSPTIDDGSQYFNTVLYTGDGNNGRTVTGLGFQSDWTWIKSRNRGDVDHILNDSTRGAGKNIYSNATYPEDTSTNKIVSFDSDGLTLNNHVSVNGSSDTYVAWNWKASGGTTTTDTSGDIDTVVQANQTAGFSILTFTSNGSSNQTIPHGLGSAPEVFWVKPRSATGSWYCYFKEIGATHYLRLNSTDAKVDQTIWGDTHPTSTLLTIDTDTVAGGTPTMLVYCFKQIEGYSKFGSYTGNGSTDGTFVYTGFRPAFVILKATSRADRWVISDSKRSTINPSDEFLDAQDILAEGNLGATGGLDILSNGFKLKNTDAVLNGSGDTYIYMAFAENPFVSSSGVPVVAR